MSSEILNSRTTNNTQDPLGKADPSAGAAAATMTTTTTTPQPMVLLQKYCRSSSTELSQTTSLSEDGKILTFHGDEGRSDDKKQSLGERCEVDAQATYDLSSITTKNYIDTFYPLSSYYLLCLHPLDLLTYRKACEKANNSTPIKITDKKIVLRALLGEEKFESSQQQSNNNSKSKSSEKDESTNKERSKTSPDKKGSSSKEKHRSSSASGSKHHHDKHKHHSKESSSSKHHSGSSKDHSKHHHKEKEKHRHSHGGTSSSKKGEESNKKTASSASKKDNKPTGPVTSEQVLENLRLVADKRSEKPTDVSKPKPSEGEQTTEGTTEKTDVGDVGKEKETTKKDGEGEEKIKTEEMDDSAKAEREREKLHSMLSQRIQVTVEQLEEDRERTKQIVANEIPVGNSFSVLRAPGRDLSKVLDILNEVKQKEAAALKAEILSSKSSKDGSGVKRKSSDITNSSSKSPGVAGDNKRAKEPKGNPIIIVPNAMTSPITMINAQMFFNDKQFMSRQDVLKQKGSSARFMGPSVSFTRKISSKYTGGLTSNDLEYEIMDNPLKLKSRSDWDRIVAVVAQGASWQFKGWPGSWSNPVDIFSRTMGFYIGMEGTPLPKELQGWNVKTLMISREKRIMDGVVHSHFFSALDEWMAIRKPEYLAVSENS